MNLKELSAILGLSQTTVSRALNGYPEVNEETRQRVLKAVQETGYRANRAAQRLATGKAHSIGLMMPTSMELDLDLHFGTFLHGLGKEAMRHDFHLVIVPTEPNDEINALKRLAESGNVDALYIHTIRNDDKRIDRLRTLSIPYLVHGRLLGDHHDYPYLDIDNTNAFYNAAKLLLDLGHTRFGLMNGMENFTFATRRRKGMIRALTERGLTLPEENMHHSQMTDAEGFLTMQRFLALPKPPTAVICGSTVLALGAVRAINQAGLKLGQDISMIAHDDVLPMLKPENFMVPLTTTRSSLSEAGVRIARRLIAQVQNLEQLPSQELWPAELIIRASTGPAPKA